ncbi:MAG: flagellar hook-basal body complex protein, partial [Campylobacteraceae bacterium]|nr:flagellar hook-basal body complex protein [Campylobacteraceae bacterium]
MMRSLWAGVSGLQAHQVAMDVEGNNIANVNTVGFKYSRTNFADMLSQTAKIATAPQDPLGGRNSLQVGLGSSVSTVTHIFSQGSRQTTDKTTDVAIEGDGFFVVSPDNGITYKYTRAGDFSFDAYGNFVDSNGFIVQGWLKDKNDKIDSTLPIKSIKIDPGMTIPARGTENVTLRANLVSGSTTNEYSPIYTLDSDSTTKADPTIANGVGGNQKPEDLGVLFNASGKAFNLQNGQGIWISFENTQVTDTHKVNGGAQKVNLTINGINIT